MSAHIVSDTTINTIVSFYCRHIDGNASGPKLAQMLIDENHLSVNSRYNENARPHHHRFFNGMLHASDLSLVALIKTCNYFDYQACETDSYNESEAAGLINACIDKAYEMGGFDKDTRSEDLEGYDAAPWGLDDEIIRGVVNKLEFVPVAKFRLVIGALEKLYHADRGACVGMYETEINRALLARQARQLVFTDCKRKNEEDQARKDEILAGVGEYLGWNIPTPEKVETIFSGRSSGYHGEVISDDGQTITMIVDKITFSVSEKNGGVVVTNHNNGASHFSDNEYCAVCIATQRTLELPTPPDKPTKEDKTKETSSADPVRAEKFEKMAEKLQSAIDAAFSERLTNTAKRLAQAAHARAKGEHLKRVQAALAALAAHHRAGTCPPNLQTIKNKKELEGLLAAKVEQIPNGYHQYSVDTGKPLYDDPTTLAAWALLTPKSPEELQEEALQRKINDLQFSKIEGFFPTPDPVIDRLFELADIDGPAHFIEPSAGAGNIADRICQQFGASVELYEVNYTLTGILENKGFHVGKSDVSAPSDFLACDISERADRIIMNPPFENLQDIEHILHAYRLLKPGGVLVSVMSPSAFFRSDKKSQAFRTWFIECDGYKEELPAGAFKESGTNINTVVIKLVKPVLQAEPAPEDNPFVENDYHGRQEARKDRAEERAAGAAAKSTALFEDAHKMSDVIPFGQPILVGHHSEKRDRNYREKFCRKYDRSFEEQKKADYYSAKAETIGTGGISSIEPEALTKLKSKLLQRESLQVRMKAANKALKKNDTRALGALGYNEQQIEALQVPDCFGGIGFASYTITNNGAEIRRLKKRVEELEALRTMPSIDIQTGDYRLYVDEGRVVFDFDVKPDEQIRALLHSNGFNWSKTRGVWVRKATSNAVYTAKWLHSQLTVSVN